MPDEKKEDRNSTSQVSLKHDSDSGEHVDVEIKMTTRGDVEDIRGEVELTLKRGSPAEELLDGLADRALQAIGLSLGGGAPQPRLAIRAPQVDAEFRELTDAQSAILDVLTGFHGLDGMSPEILDELEDHLLTRVPFLEKLLSFLKLGAPENEQMEVTRAAVLKLIFEAGEGGALLGPIKRTLGCPDEVWSNVIDRLVKDGRIRLIGEGKAVWVIKPGEDENDLGVLNSAYDGMGGTPGMQEKPNI